MIDRDTRREQAFALDRGATPPTLGPIPLDFAPPDTVEPDLTERPTFDLCSVALLGSIIAGALLALIFGFVGA